MVRKILSVLCGALLIVTVGASSRPTDKIFTTTEVPIYAMGTHQLVGYTSVKEVKYASLGDCYDPHFCIWSYPNYGTSMKMYPILDSTVCLDITGSWDNNADSAAVSWPYTMTLYVNHGPDMIYGDYEIFDNGWQQDPDLNNSGSIGRNTASSICGGAGTGQYHCASVSLCLFNYPNYMNYTWQSTTAQSVGTCTNLPALNDNNPDSVDNPGAGTWVLYDNYNCSTAGGSYSVHIYPGQFIDDLDTHRNIISSVYRVS